MKNKKAKEENNKKWKIRLLLVILIIIWAIVVFKLSDQNGEESGGLSQKIAYFIFRTEEIVKVMEPIIRKLAHFSEYAVGGILFYSLFSTYNYKKISKIAISFSLGVWYSALDEIHQLFIPGRSGNIIDVGIDSLGVCFGIIISIIFSKIYINI